MKDICFLRKLSFVPVIQNNINNLQFYERYPQIIASAVISKDKYVHSSVINIDFFYWRTYARIRINYASGLDWIGIY